MIITQSTEDKKSTCTWVFSHSPSRGYLISTVICQNPFCACGSLDLSFLDTTLDNARVFGINVDVLARTQIKTDVKGTKEQEALKQLFMEEATDEDWLKLYRLFYLSKASIIDEYDYDGEIYGSLPIDIHETESSNAMLAYSEIFPHGTKILLDVRGAPYLIDEQFCPKENCPCTNVCLGIIPVKEGQTTGSESVFLLDYKHWKLKPLSGVPDGFPSMGEILQALRDHPDTSAAKIKKRHSRIKLVYRKFKEQSDWIEITKIYPAVSGGKIGRNDPCPCGSGKKYKRCCA